MPRGLAPAKLDCSHHRRRARNRRGRRRAAVTDTIKESADGKFIERTLDRSKLWSVQTPQTFRVEVIRRAIADARKRRLIITDDTAACELIGQPVRLVSQRNPNPKVTVRGICRSFLYCCKTP